MGTGFIVQGINDIDNTETQLSNGGGLSERRLIGVFGDATLSYKHWAFLTVAARNDWSSTLPVANRSFIYPAVSASVILTDALSIQNDILNFLKLRASLGYVGNDAAPYQTSSIFSINPALGNGNLGSPFTNANVTNSVNVITEGDILGNPELKPEFTREYEFGVEANLWNNRISLDVAYYDKSTTDQIIGIQSAPASGFTNRVINAGEVTNKGLEASLSVTPVQLDNSFKWTVSSVFTMNENLVVSLGDTSLDQIIIGGFSNLGITHRAGLPYGQILGSDILRAEDDGLPLINPSTGLYIDDPEPRIIGDPNPDFQWSVTNSVSFKGITLSFLFDWKKGGDQYCFTCAQIRGRGISTETTELPGGREVGRVLPGWLADAEGEFLLDDQEERIPNNVLVTVNDYYFIDGLGSAGANIHNVFDASTIRLREISLSYTFPKSLLSKTPFGSAVLSLSGRNLWYLAYNVPRSLNYDPEVNSLDGNSTGVDFSTIPTVRRYGINLRLTL